MKTSAFPNGIRWNFWMIIMLESAKFRPEKLNHSKPLVIYIAVCQLFPSEFCRRPRNSSMNSAIVRKWIEKYFISYRHVWIESSRFVHYQGMKLQHPKVCLWNQLPALYHLETPSIFEWSFCWSLQNSDRKSWTTPNIWFYCCLSTFPVGIL